MNDPVICSKDYEMCLCKIKTYWDFICFKELVVWDFDLFLVKLFEALHQIYRFNVFICPFKI